MRNPVSALVGRATGLPSQVHVDVVFEDHLRVDHLPEAALQLRLADEGDAGAGLQSASHVRGVVPDAAQGSAGVVAEQGADDHAPAAARTAVRFLNDARDLCGRIGRELVDATWTDRLLVVARKVENQVPLRMYAESRKLLRHGGADAGRKLNRCGKAPVGGISLGHAGQFTEATAGRGTSGRADPSERKLSGGGDGAFVRTLHDPSRRPTLARLSSETGP